MGRALKPWQWPVSLFSLPIHAEELTNHFSSAESKRRTANAIPKIEGFWRVCINPSTLKVCVYVQLFLTWHGPLARMNTCFLRQALKGHITQHYRAKVLLKFHCYSVHEIWFCALSNSLKVFGFVANIGCCNTRQGHFIHLKCCSKWLFSCPLTLIKTFLWPIPTLHTVKKNYLQNFHIFSKNVNIQK